jgi:hypothetical protein
LKIWERIICVALWHVLMRHAVGALGRPDTLEIKLRAFGFNNKADFVEKKLYLLQSQP